jgi:hypothetical protein
VNDVDLIRMAEAMGLLNRADRMMKTLQRLLEQARAVAAHLEEEAATCPDLEHHGRGRA